MRKRVKDRTIESDWRLMIASRTSFETEGQRAGEIMAIEGQLNGCMVAGSEDCR